MIATSTMNMHALDESSARDMQGMRRSDSMSISPPRKSPSKQIGAENENSDEIRRNLDNESSSEKVVTESTPPLDDGDEDTEENNSGSSQCSCRMWTCSQCNKAFNSARALKIHEVKQHENMPKRYLKCSHCDEVFEHGNLLQIHMKVHHNIKVRCPQCKDIFDHPKALSMHVKAHNTEPVCPVCGVKFDHDKLLKLHMEHYHKVSKKESAALPAEQLEVQTFQPLANLISPDSNQASESPERRRNGNSLSPNEMLHKRETTPSPARDDHVRKVLQEAQGEERTSRQSSLSPHEVNSENNQESIRREMFVHGQGYNNLYHHRLLAPVHNRPLFYRPLNEKSLGPPPFGLMSFQPPGLRRRIEKRPLGRSHSLPLKQETAYHDVSPGMPWHFAEANPMMYGAVPREKKIDRAVLEAVRSSLKAKLRTVEATLLGEEVDSHQPLSSALSEFYEQQGLLRSREELPRPPYRPSVITSRTAFDAYSFKRKASPSDLEPQEKIRLYEKEALHDNIESPSASPSHNTRSFSFIAGSERRPRFHDSDPPIYPRPFDTRDDLSILKRTDDLDFSDQARIFIKRGAPRCNRCQQTFSSKMEYLHHLISHREKDGFADESPEEMEFIEGVRRTMDLQNFAMAGLHRTSATNSKGSLSPRMEENFEKKEIQNAGRNEDDDTEVDKPTKKTKDNNSPVDQPSLAPQNEGDALSLGTATCSECKDVFADSMSCRMHIEKRHMKPRCRECGLTFDHKNLLKIHMDCYHSTLDVLQCYYCGMSFKQRSEFLDHVTSHEAQEINKDKLSEHANESNEPGGRRRWGRLVASAQLPSEKPDSGNKESIPSKNDLLGSRETLLKSNGKTKLRKAVSLSTYTDMINRNKRRAADILHDSRAKGDEVIGRETRTRIFLPNFEDSKIEGMSRFHDAHSISKKELSSPVMARQSSASQDGAERLFLERKAFQSKAENEARTFWSAGRPPFTADTMEERRDPAGSYSAKKNELQRLQRATTGDEEIRAQHIPLFRKAFVRDEVETLYQLRHKKSFHSTEGSDRDSLSPNPLDHRNALVKIERVELNPVARQSKPVDHERGGLRMKYDSEKRNETVSSVERRRDVPEKDDYSSEAHSGSSPKRYPEETTNSAAPPPPLIDIRTFSQNSSPLNVCSGVSTDSSPSSSRSNSPLTSSVKNHEYKTKRRVEPDSHNCPVESVDASMKDSKGKRRNSIKKLTKEALINSLSLKRRASAPDLYQMQRDSTECNSAEKVASPKTDSNASPGSPSVSSDGRASPDQRSDTKHHGARSVNYTPRRQTDRDVTCTQCGVSFGHKKLYKIHLDSYHGKPLGHECLQCGSKSFRDKDEFLKHLMAHQTESKNKGREKEGEGNCNTNSAEKEGFEDTRQSNSPYGKMDDDSEMEPKRKIPKRESAQEDEASNDNSMDDVVHFAPQGRVINYTSKHENDLNDDSEQPSPLGNDNATELNEKGTVCFTCGKSFENGKQLEQHFSSHASISKDGRYCCVLCGKAFETHRKLEIHSRSHTGFKPHKCDQCGRCFPYYSSYYYHKMTHTKDRPHKCPLCGKGFIQTRYLRSHLRTHKDEQGTLSDEVESIIQKVELNMNDETDEESIDSPGTAEGSPAYRANDEEAETAEILCSFKRGLNCSAQNSDAESPGPVASNSSD